MTRLRRALLAVLAAVSVAAPYAVANEPPQLPCVDPVLPCPKPAPKPQPKQGRDLTVFHGLGTWVDAYDYSREFGGRLQPGAVDDMANLGVKTLYIQGSKDRDGGSTGVLSPDLLGAFLERAHAHKMRVVAWYLPRFLDPSRDWAHVNAMLAFRSNGQRFDAIGIDIESREQSDVTTRNDRLVGLSSKLRQAAGSIPTAAIVVPPVVTDVINPNFWPQFPWSRIKPSYDAWIPMSYWTNRAKQPEWRDAYKYSSENAKLLRKDLGDPNAPVHIAGGVGTTSTSKDYDGLVRAATDTKSTGISVYDYQVTAKSAYPTLRRGPS